MARITLIGKPGCHLCDVAQVVIERVAADAGADWEKISIEDDPALYKAYWEQIPVILVDGKQHSHWHVDEHRLRRALDGVRQGSRPS